MEDKDYPSHVAKNPNLSPKAIQSIVTIPTSSGVNDSSFFPSKWARPSTIHGTLRPSVAMITLNSHETPFSSVSFVARCTTSRFRSSSQSGGGRISIAIHTQFNEGNKRDTVQMKHSKRIESGHKMVCLVPFGDSAVLLAMDTMGELFYCNIEEGTKKKSRLLTMKHCQCLCGNPNDLTFMNTLTPRIDTISQSRKLESADNLNQRSSSTSSRYDRKRKNRGPPQKSDTDENTIDANRRVYVVASCLNAPIPSDAGPIVLCLSSHEVSGSTQYQCVATTKISLDPSTAPMTCITFVSKAMCGRQLWDIIASTAMIREASDVDHVEGVVFMGFQDGSLRVSIVHKTRSLDNTTIQSSHVATLLASYGQAPLLSLQLLSPSSDDECSLLVCTREDGSLVVLSSTFVHQQSFKFERRVVSMCIADYEYSASEVELTLIGVYDCGNSFMHHAFFRVDSGSICDWKEFLYRLPLPNGLSVSMPTCYTNSPSGCLFTMSLYDGNVTLFKMHPDVCRQPMHTQLMLSQSDEKSPILARFQSKSSTSLEQTTQKIASTAELSTHESLLKKLESIITNEHDKQVTKVVSPSPTVVPEAIQEIREALRISSYLTSDTMRSNSLWRFDGEKVTLNASILRNQNMNNWDTAVHVMTMKPEFLVPNPSCYRLSRKGLSYAKVLYGGVVQSICGKSPEHVISAFTTATNLSGSLQMKYNENKRQYPTKTIIDTPLGIGLSSAAKCSSLLHITPIHKSQQSSRT